MSAATALQLQKRALRKTVASVLRALPRVEIEEQSKRIAERVVQTPWFPRAHSICCYLNMPSGEVDTGLLISSIFQASKTLYVPRVDTARTGHMDFLQLHGESDLSALPADLWGIREPDLIFDNEARTNAVDPGSAPLDIIFVPGVAFDRGFSRLGHGKGYYDRFLTTYTTARVALALREQLVDNVPTAAHDWTVDMIVTPDEILSRPELDAASHGVVWKP
ncbi:nagb/rpia/CoA transferase-like protein [Peniophora sp. CONT]|nr:nagb/rpia/CoA transferase-like protein [Peniophora sp. CONT]